MILEDHPAPTDLSLRAVRFAGLHLAACHLALEGLDPVVDRSGHGKLRVVDTEALTTREVLVRVKRFDVWQVQCDRELHYLKAEDIAFVDLQDGRRSVTLVPAAAYVAFLKGYQARWAAEGRPLTPDSQHIGITADMVRLMVERGLTD